MSNFSELFVVAEGATEQMFLGRVLAPYWAARGIFVRATQISKKGQRGGDVKFSRAQRDVVNFLKQRRDTLVATFVDYYGVKEWPGLESARKLSNPSPRQVADALNRASVSEILKMGSELGAEERYVPFVAVHEFESLLFSDVDILASSIGIERDEIQKVIDIAGSPEDINNSPSTAPSKRLYDWTSGSYSKVSSGVSIATKIGIDKMRSACPNFERWMKSVELLCGVH